MMRFKLLRKMIPGSLKSFLKNQMIPYKEIVKNFYCPVCKNKLHTFERLPDSLYKELDKYQFIHSWFSSETSNYLSYSCPICGASDRERLYALYLEKKLNSNEKIKFLDFAPSYSLKQFIKNFNHIEYRSADIMGDRGDDIVDIQDMKLYKDNSFDVFLCSHVLEHVENDKKAIKELFRILKPNGWGILMVPINLMLTEILENPAYSSEADRWKYYGQNDHVRMYSKTGFIARIEEAGFKINQFGSDYFGSETFEKHGIHPRSVLYVVEK